MQWSPANYWCHCLIAGAAQLALFVHVHAVGTPNMQNDVKGSLICVWWIAGISGGDNEGGRSCKLVLSFKGTAITCMPSTQFLPDQTLGIALTITTPLRLL